MAPSNTVTGAPWTRGGSDIGAPGDREGPPLKSSERPRLWYRNAGLVVVGHRQERSSG